MIEIRKVQTTDGHRIDLFIPSKEKRVIEAQDLMLFPGLINPHVNHRNQEFHHKNIRELEALAVIAGGITTVFDMPTIHSSSSASVQLQTKQQLIDDQLRLIDIPFRCYLCMRADVNHLKELPKIKNQIVGLKISLSASQVDPEDRTSLEEAFRIAAKHEITVVFQAENSRSLHTEKGISTQKLDSVSTAIALAKKHKTRLYIVDATSQQELDLIRAAKKDHLPIYVEASPHDLFPHQFMPTEDNSADLWEAIQDGTIDTIGTTHVPCEGEETARSSAAVLSYSSSTELYFPLLLNAYHEKKLSLEQIVSLTHTRPQEIFHLPLNEDVVLVDLHKKKKIEDRHLTLTAKGIQNSIWTLQGWPRYIISNGKLFDLEKL